MANYRKFVTRDNKKITKDQITIAGSVTRQQHKLSQCVVAKVSTVDAKFCPFDGHSSWRNIRGAFTEYKTESKVEAGLKAHDFILERIIPDPSRKPIFEFRIRNRERLYSLAEGVDDKSLGKLVLDYMIPEGKRKSTDVLIFNFDASQYDQLEEKLQEIQSNSDVSYNIYTTSRRVDDKVPQKRTEIPYKENPMRGKNMSDRHENTPRSILGNVENVK